MNNNFRQQFIYSLRLLSADLILSVSLTAICYYLPVNAAETTTSTQTAADSETQAEPETQADPETQAEPETQADPEISVVPCVTSIEPLANEESEFSFDAKPSLEEVTAKLPSTLSVFLDNSSETIDIPVSWECSDDYTNTKFNVYDFNPVWDTDAYPLSPELDTYSGVPYIIVKVWQARATTTLSDIEQAQSALNSLAGRKDILALVYLCDSYEIKENPEKESGTVISVGSGLSVQIVGVDQDTLCNIWYQVKIDMNDTSYTGYIERKYLACSDEDLLAWEGQWIHDQANLFRSAVPALLSDDSDNGIPDDIAAFPSSYQTALLNLKAQHPNWIFVKMTTDVDWNTAIQEENSDAHGVRSLISSSVNAAWKKASYDNAWSYPTDGILAYYMDPRNFLTDNYIFQFEFLSYNKTYHVESAVQSILNNTFMTGTIPGDSQTYAQAFCRIGQQLNVSPFHLASRVRQEQGDGKSALISGLYPAYPGLYNYFNIGATGKGNQAVIENGLKKAQSYGWTTRYLSLYGGAEIISKSYINKGQDTLYLQKFNVNKYSSSGLFNHQYMQNIAAPSSEAISVKNAYVSAGSVNNPFVFRIPVFNNMPGNPCAKPSSVKELKLSKSSLTLSAGKTAALTVSIDGKNVDNSTVSFSSSNPQIATVDKNGTITALTAGSATISCSATGAGTASCAVTVSKSTPVYTVPALSAITYHSAQTLSSIALPSGWSWDNPSIVPTVNNAGYPATFVPSDTNAYDVVKQTLALTVNKGIPAYSIPAGLQVVAGNNLGSVTLPSGFLWEDPAAIPKKTGNYTVSYNPDEANYQTVTGISVPVTVIEKSAGCTTHSYGEWVITKAAKCTAAGVQEHYCNICGVKETSAVPALGHSYSSSVTKPATESENGIRTYVCSRCGDTYTEEIAKLPVSHTHHYTSKVTKAASCTASGVTTYTCSCGDTYMEEVPAVGHSYTSKITKDATEKENGIRTYTCSKCGSSYTETIAKLPASHKHSYSSAITKQPGCTEKGIKTYTCSCGDTYTEEISSLGHDMSDGKCRRCGYTAAETNSSSGTGSSNTDNSGTGASGNNGSDSSNSSETGSSSQINAPSKITQTDSANNTTESKTDAVPDSAKNAKNESTSAAQAENKNSVTLDMRNTTVLYEESLSSVRGQDVNVVLNMGNNISWTINGKNILADEANGVDMGVTVNAQNIPKSIMDQAAAISATGNVIELSLAHDGALDFQPVLTLNTASDNVGHIAALFYYNPASDTLEFKDEVKIKENGDICFTFSHASDYVIIISEKSLASTAAITNDGTADNSVGTADLDSSSSQPEPSMGNENVSDASPVFSKTAIIVIAIILLVLIAIGFTIFFMFHAKEKNDMEDDEFEEDNEIEEDTADESITYEYIDIGSQNEEDQENDLLSDDAFDDFIDDYHEPEIKSQQPKNQIPFTDEFDGFE